MTYNEVIQARLTAAQANHKQKLAEAPDMCAAQAAINAFRSEHAELKRRKEDEFLASQKAATALALAEIELAKAEKAALKALQFSEMEHKKEEKLARKLSEVEHKKAAQEAEEKAETELAERQEAQYQAERRAAIQKAKGGL